MNTPTLWKPLLLLASVVLVSSCKDFFLVKSGPPPVIKPVEGTRLEGKEIDSQSAANQKALNLTKEVLENYSGRTWYKLNAKPWHSQDHQNMLVDLYANRLALQTVEQNSHQVPTHAVFYLKSWFSEEKQISGPSWIMIKMPPGYDREYGDWFYAEISPKGQIIRYGNSRNLQVRSCMRCHLEVEEERDSIYPIPSIAR